MVVRGKRKQQNNNYIVRPFDTGRHIITYKQPHNSGFVSNRNYTPTIRGRICPQEKRYRMYQIAIGTEAGSYGNGYGTKDLS